MEEISKSKIDFSSPIKIFSLSWLRDGGSVILHCGNASGQEFKLEFYQHMMLLMDIYRLFPGRIHLNNELVKDYSDLEESIIQGLKVASFEFVYAKKEDQQMDQKILAEKLTYVRSASYSLNNQKVRDHMRENGMN